jgi:(p)ppGpp synthase/HD superfamily hydrolase
VEDRSSTLEFSRELPKTQVAVEYARRQHEGQQRQVDGQPFILHPLEVGSTRSRSQTRPSRNCIGCSETM